MDKRREAHEFDLLADIVAIDRTEDETAVPTTRRIGILYRDSKTGNIIMDVRSSELRVGCAAVTLYEPSSERPVETARNVSLKLIIGSWLWTVCQLYSFV